MSTDATRAHIDAETLAAWADHGLSADASAAVELHLSNCDRCQEVLAAFVRSAPVAGAVVIPFWARRPVQWSAAGLAAAAALVAMVWIGRPPAVPTPESTVAGRAVDSITPSIPSPPSQTPPPSQRSLSELQRDRTAAAAEQRADKPAAKAAKQALEKKESVPARPAAPAPEPSFTAVVAAPPPITVSAAAPVVTPRGGRAAANAQMSARAESLSDAFSAVIPVIEIFAPEPSPAAFRSVGGVAAGRGGAGGTRALTESPGPTRWRIVGGTRVERTANAGATWTALPIDPPLTTLLLAGVATSQSNCWLVGREGVVLVTTDGRTFRRVSVPEVVHLTAVTASDGMRATVTAVDGRTFSTIDGGITWK